MTDLWKHGHHGGLATLNAGARNLLQALGVGGLTDWGDKTTNSGHGSGNVDVECSVTWLIASAGLLHHQCVLCDPTETCVYNCRLSLDNGAVKPTLLEASIIRLRTKLDIQFVNIQAYLYSRAGPVVVALHHSLTELHCKTFSCRCLKTT